MKQMVLILVTKKVTGIRSGYTNTGQRFFLNCSKSGENILIHEEYIRNVVTDLLVLRDAQFQEKSSGRPLFHNRETENSKKLQINIFAKYYKMCNGYCV